MILRRILIAALALLLAGQGVAQASTYYYFRAGAQAIQASGSKPASPTPQGTFAILIDAPEIGVRGTGYSATTYAYSNVGAVVFSVQSGSLPAGISINATTGTISGTPSAIGTSSLVIQGVDSSTGAVATTSLTIEVDDPFSISGTPGALVLKNSPYSADFTLAGGGQPYGFSVGALPPGLAFNAGAATANIGGVPTQAGSYNIIVTGSEVHGLVAQYPYTLQVYDTLAISGAPPATATIGTPYSGQLTVTGGSAPFTYTLAAGSLPIGVTLKAATGVISGTPTTAGIKSNIRIKVADATGQSATSAPFSIAVGATGLQPLTISATPTTTGRENQAYTTQYTAGGGSGSYIFSMVGGPLPSGVALNAASGLISGTPLGGTAGTYPNITAQVVDAGTHEAIAVPYTLTIAPAQIALSVTGSPASSVQLGSPYAAQFAGNGGTGAGYVFALGAGTLPAGLSLSPTGMLSGTPSAVGSFTGIKIRVTDNASNTALSNQFTINVVSPPPLQIFGNPAPSATAGNSYSATWTALDGSGAGYHFTSVGGALPPGLALSDINGAQGLLSGIATTPGIYSGLQIRVVDDVGNEAVTPVFSVNVAPATQNPGTPQDPLALFGTPVDAVYGQPYSVTFAAGGGSPSYVYSITGTLPAELTLDPASGALAGTPSQIGNFPGLQVTVTDSLGATASSSVFAIAVADPAPLTITWTPQTNWQIGDFVAIAPDVLGGDPANYQFSSIGTLPSGLSLFSNGTLFGNLSQAGTFGPFQIQVTDGVRTAVTSPATTFSVASPSLFVSGFPPADADENQPYSAQFSAQSGSGGYVYSMIGTLPSGLSLDASSGLLSGVPTIGSAGTYANLAVRVTDDASASAESAPFSITVHPLPALVVVGNAPTGSTLGGSYSFQFAATGGSGYVFSLGSGTLPNGLAVAADGTLAGSPTQTGTFGPLQVRVTDAASRTALSAPFSIDVVDDAPLSITWAPQTTWVKGSTLSVSAAASGGVPSSYVFGVTGTLPAGVTQNPADGSLSGTVGTVGTYGPITITLTDGLRNAATAPATFSVVYPAVVATGSPPTSAALGTDYAGQYSASGGSGAGYAFSLQSGSLPPGLTISAAGAISGKPTSTGSFGPATIKLVDGVGGSTTVQLSITVTDQAPMLVSWTPTTAITLGQSISATPTPSGGLLSGYVWGHTGTLPPGVSQSASGALTGTPSSVGSYGPIAITLSDGYRSASTTPATFTVSYPGLAVAGSPPAANLGVAYSSQLTPTGGSGSGYVFSLASGTLPTGLTLSSGGLISGTPSATGSFGPFTVSLLDGASNTALSAPFSINVVDDAPLSITWTPQTSYVRGDAVVATTTPSGGVPASYAFSSSGTLPPGTALDTSSGAITGTATAVGTYGPVTVTVTDGLRTATTSPVTFTVAYPALAISGSPAATALIGTGYSASYSATGGDGAFTFSIGSGTKPSWMTIDAASGTLGGTPDAAGSFTFAVKVADGQGASATAPALTLVVSSPRQPFVVVGGPASISGTAGNALAASGVDVGYNSTNLSTPSLAVMQGATPFDVAAACGLAFDPVTGRISGTPTTACAATGLTVKATDSDGETASTAPFDIAIAAALSAPTGSFGGGSIGTAYSKGPLSVSGGKAPYVWSVASGSLPAGLSLEATTGVLSGTPSAAGTSVFTVRVTDANSASSPASAAQTVAIAGTPVSISGTPGNATAGTAYGFVPTVSGGTAPFRFSVVSLVNAANRAQTLAELGLSFSPLTGAISGTPTAGGKWSGTIEVIDAAGSQATTASLAITVTPSGAPVILGGGPTTWLRNATYPQTFFKATGGQMFYRWTLTGSVPTGLTINSFTGLLSGTPTAAGTFAFNVVATGLDGAGTAASKAITMTVTDSGSAFRITASTDALIYNLSPGQVPSVTFNATGASGAVTYAMSGNDGSGLSVNPSTGAWVGVIPAGVFGSWNIVVTGTDAAGFKASYTVRLLSAHRAYVEGLSSELFVNGVSQGVSGSADTMSVAASASLTAVGDTIEMVFPQPVVMTQVLLQAASSYPPNAVYQIARGDGTSYVSCGNVTMTGSGRGALPSCLIVGTVADFASTHFRYKVVSINGPLSGAQLGGNGFYNPTAMAP
jgi:hypothetical protein